MGARAGRSHDRRPPSCADNAHRPAIPRRPVVRRLLGACQNEAGITVVAHAGDSGYSSQGYAATASPHHSAGTGRPSIKMLAVERADLRLPALAGLRWAVRAIPERPDRLRRERLGVPTRLVPEGAIRATQDPRRVQGGSGRALPTKRVDQSVLGGRSLRSGRAHGGRRVIFGSDWPHIEGDADASRLRSRDQGARRGRPTSGTTR